MLSFPAASCQEGLRGLKTAAGIITMNYRLPRETTKLCTFSRIVPRLVALYIFKRRPNI